MRRKILFSLPLLAAACTPDARTAAPPSRPPAPLPTANGSPALSPREPTPALRLPADVRPLEERIELTVHPAEARFRGVAEIAVQLDRPRRVVWLHGKDLHVSSASLVPENGQPIAATWTQEEPHGTAALALAEEAPAGNATLRIAYDGAFIDGQRGLYKVTEANVPYAFTQFEAIDARDAFPCFDEPGFKIPFALTLVVPKDQVAIANTPEAERAPAGDDVRVRFAPTKPIPSYLVAFAVGPFDVLAAKDVPPDAARTRPLPLRGIAPKGRGGEFAYALAHAGEIVSTLEEYFGIEYPYEKLDLLAVPGKPGAMENPGAVTFAESLLLFDPKTAPVWQKKSYAYVVAHELAHQWFGDLVTMAWWDDTWLNESFATWMGSKAADRWDPSSEARLDLLGGIQGAIGQDGLVSARSIRQPIESIDDIQNAFDGITYQKGGGVLSMFERWLGEDTFRAGVRLHLSQHRFGSATADDFLGALSTAAKKDVKTPMHTFLDQPGVPYVEAKLACDGGHPRVELAQSRYLPRGSTGDANKSWQVPVCVRYEAGGATKEACTLLAEKQGELALDTPACPKWIFPNADAAGYYRFALSAPDLAKLREGGLAALSTREKIAFGNGLRAAYGHGTTPFGDVLRAASALADDPEPQVAEEPAYRVGEARDWLYAEPVRPAIEAYAKKLYAKQLAKLGWAPRNGEPQSATRLRQHVIGFLANTARDPAVRAEAKRRALAFLGQGKDGAIHADAVDENMVGTVLSVLGQDADATLFDAILARFAKTDEEVLRGQLLGALSAARDPALAARARDLALDPRVRVTEALEPIGAQLGDPETREAAWTWLKEHWDPVIARLSGNTFGGAAVLSMVESFCDQAHADDAARFLGERAKAIEGGPRTLASSLEGIRLCIVRRTAEEPNARAFFAQK